MRHALKFGEGRIGLLRYVVDVQIHHASVRYEIAFIPALAVPAPARIASPKARVRFAPDRMPNHANTCTTAIESHDPTTHLIQLNGLE